jgi:hypothetical protein
MSGTFGVPVKVEGMTDVNTGLVNIQRALSNLFSQISSVVVTTNLIVSASPFLNSGTVGSAGTITAATLTASGLLGGHVGAVAGVVVLGPTLIDNANTLDAIQVLGTTTNSSAAAGFVGEYILSTVLVGSAIALTTATPANVTSISLTAGDWDVWGSVAFNPGASTTITVESGGIGITSATLPISPGAGAYASVSATFTTGAGDTLPVGMTRLSLAAPTTVYLVAQASFAVSTMGAYGFIGARRRR